MSSADSSPTYGHPDDMLAPSQPSSYFLRPMKLGLCVPPRSPLSGHSNADMKASCTTGNPENACTSVLTSRFGVSCRLALPPYRSHACSCVCSPAWVVMGSYGIGRQQASPVCTPFLPRPTAYNHTAYERCAQFLKRRWSHRPVPNPTSYRQRGGCKSCRYRSGPQQDIVVLANLCKAKSQRH